MANLNDLDDVTISNPRAGDVVKYTATGWTNAADATGDPVGGNPCGNLDGYTRDDRKETITEPWVWDLTKDNTFPYTDDVITVKDEGGNIGYFGPRRTRNANNLGFVKMQIKDDGQGLLQAQNTLSFVDSQVPNGITLAELIAGGSGGGSGSTGEPNRILSAKFKFGGSELSYSQSFKNWSETPGLVSADDKRYLNWKESDPLEVTLPDWATGAVVVYIQNHRFEVSDDITEHPNYGVAVNTLLRQYTAHKVSVENGEYVVSGGENGQLMVNVLNSNLAIQLSSNTTELGSRTTYQETTNYQFVKLTGSSKTLRFTQTVDLIRAGWNKITCGTGKMLVFPIVFNQDDVFSAESDVSGFVVRNDQDYLDLLDAYYPPYSETDLLLEDSTELKNSIVYALNVCNDALVETPGDATIESIRSNLFALKTETSLSFAQARFKVLIGELRTALTWKFPWEPAGYSLIGD